MKKLIFLPVAIFIAIMVILVYKKQNSRETDVKDLEDLHEAYAKTISIPIKNDSIEVLIFRYSGPDCGNTLDEDYQLSFLPDLTKDPYRKNLSSQHQSLRFLTEYDSLVTTIPENKKLYVQAFGIVDTRTQVSILEKYQYGEEIRDIVKTATYNNGEWEIIR